jgi:hypothetical protein
VRVENKAPEIYLNVLFHRESIDSQAAAILGWARCVEIRTLLSKYALSKVNFVSKSEWQGTSRRTICVRKTEATACHRVEFSGLPQVAIKMLSRTGRLGGSDSRSYRRSELGWLEQV